MTVEEIKTFCPNVFIQNQDFCSMEIDLSYPLKVLKERERDMRKIRYHAHRNGDTEAYKVISEKVDNVAKTIYLLKKLQNNQKEFLCFMKYMNL